MSILIGLAPKPVFNAAMATQVVFQHPVRCCMGLLGKSDPACKGRIGRVRRAHQEPVASAGAHGAPYEVRSFTLKRQSLNATHYRHIAISKGAAEAEISIACQGKRRASAH